MPTSLATPSAVGVTTDCSGPLDGFSATIDGTVVVIVWDTLSQPAAGNRIYTASDPKYSVQVTVSGDVVSSQVMDLSPTATPTDAMAVSTAESTTAFVDVAELGGDPYALSLVGELAYVGATAGDPNGRCPAVGDLVPQ